MSKAPPVRTASPAPAAEAPPDLSGGGDVIVEAPAEGRSTRPGPQPKVIRETFSNPSMATSPDVKLLNERKYDAARSKVRGMALEKMPDIGVGSKLPGPTPIPVEGEEPVETETDETPVADAPKLDEKTAAQLAAKDRETRVLRQKIKAIEQSGQSAAKKEAKLKELAKTNPKGVAEYFGIDFQTYLGQVRDGSNTPLALEDEPAARPENEETDKLRDENARLRAAENRRIVHDVVTQKIAGTKTEEGKLKWPRIARVGQAAVQAVAKTVVEEVNKMRKLTPEEAQAVLEHFLDEKEAEYRAAGAAEDRPQGRQPPNPRKPTTVPKGSPMEMKHAKDETDPRNRPTSREIAAKLRARLIG